VLVDKLLGRLLQQYHEVVEPLDYPLQPYAVGKVHQYRYLFLPELVEECILQVLYFGIALHGAPPFSFYDIEFTPIIQEKWKD
jgi:hypothetical protein